MRLFSSGRYAAITSTLALVVALSGVSYAAVLVTGSDIKDNSITSKDIKDKTIKTKDISADAKDALKGKTGPAGPTGATGPVGPSNAFSVFNDNVTLLTTTSKTVLTLSVPAGSYTASAKAIVFHTAGAGTTATCILAGGGQFDYALATPYDSAASYAMLTNQIVFTTVAPSNVTLSCYSNGGTNYVTWKKVTAIQVGSVSNNPGANVARHGVKGPALP